MRGRFFIAGLAIALVSCVASVASAAPVRYFLVAERPGLIGPTHGDSFVLPLTNWTHIHQARTQIRFPNRRDIPRLVSAKIDVGYDGINRDLLADRFRPWRWHVTEFEGFYDGSIELVDSWPTYVNANIRKWMRETGGAIGFWNYQIVGELPNFNPAVAVKVPPIVLHKQRAQTAASPAIPTPAAAPLGVAALLALLLRRRR